jgi:hypothetical protein
MVFNRDGHPRRPPNAYILCRSCAGKEAANQWKSFPPSVRLFWENTAEMLANEHKLLFPDYTYQPVRGRTKKARGLSNRTGSSKVRPRRRGPYESGDKISASGPAIVHEGSHDFLATSSESGLPELSSTSGSPSAAYNCVENSCVKGPNRDGRPKAPLNGFIFFKSFSHYNTQQASRIWNNLTFEEKRWWNQIARLAKEDLQRVTLAINDIRLVNLDDPSIPEESRTLNAQPQLEQELSPALFQVDQGSLVVPPYTELPACVPLCTNHAVEDLFNGYQWEPQRSTTFQDRSLNTDTPNFADWSTLINFNSEPHSWRPWTELSTGPSPGQVSPLDLEFGLPLMHGMAATSGAESTDATFDFLHSMLGLSSVPETY